MQRKWRSFLHLPNVDGKLAAHSARADKLVPNMQTFAFRESALAMRYVREWDIALAEFRGLLCP